MDIDYFLRALENLSYHEDVNTTKIIYQGRVPAVRKTLELSLRLQRIIKPMHYYPCILEEYSGVIQRSIQARRTPQEESRHEIKGAMSRNQFREGRNVVGAAEMAVAVPLSVTRAERVLGVGDWFDPAAAWQAAVEVSSVKVSKILVKL